MKILGTDAPKLPTSISGAKSFGKSVGAVALFGLTVVLGFGLLRTATPYLAKVPVVGSLLRAGPTGPSDAVDGLGWGA